MKRGYVNSIKGSTIAFILFVLLVQVISGKGPSSDVEILLTISTFLFAIFGGFYISRLNSRHNTIREIIMNEDAYMLSLYKNAELLGKTFAKKVAKHIDTYYIIAFDYTVDFSVGEFYYKYNAPQLFKIYDELGKLPKSKRDDSAYQNVLSYLATIEEGRNKSSVLDQERLSKGQWMILIFLAAIIIVNMFVLKTDTFFSHTVTVLLLTAVVLVLLTLRDLHNLKLSNEDSLLESGQEVLEFIGIKRYYHKQYLERKVTIPDHVKTVRVGYHKIGEKHDIKVEEVSKYTGK